MATTKKTTSAAKTTAKASKATAAKTASKSTKTAPAKKAAITTTKSGKKSTATKATETKKATAKVAPKKAAETKKSAPVLKKEKVKTEKVKATKEKAVKEKTVKTKATKEKVTTKIASAKEKAKPVKAKTTTSKPVEKKKTVAKKTVKPEAEPKKKVAAPAAKVAKVDPKAEKTTSAKVVKTVEEAPAEEKEVRKTGFVHRRKRKSEETGPKEVVIARRTLDDIHKNPKDGEHSKMMASFHPKRRSLLENADDNKEPVYRYSDEDLREFKNIILQRLDKARQELAYLQGVITRKSEAGTDDTDNRYNHLEDSPTLEREKLSQLASRQVQFIRHLENALIRIENKTYGICRVTGKLISKERLRVVPHATLSIEAKKMRK